MDTPEALSADKREPELEPDLLRGCFPAGPFPSFTQEKLDPSGEYELLLGDRS